MKVKFYRLSWREPECECEDVYVSLGGKQDLIPQWWAPDVKFDEVPDCELHPMRRPAARRSCTLKLKVSFSKPQDIIWGPYSELVVTERVAEAVTESGLTGFELRPAEVIFRKSRSAPSDPGRYFELAITGYGGIPHPDSGAELLYACPKCGSTMYTSYDKLLPDPSQWDGSDFFTIGHWQSMVHMTPRAADLIRERGFAQCYIYPSECQVWWSGRKTDKDDPRIQAEVQAVNEAIARWTAEQEAAGGHKP
jgi:hypothetical protein